MAVSVREIDPGAGGGGSSPTNINREYMQDDAGAQTNDPIIDNVAPGTHIVITAFQLHMNAIFANGFSIRVGFGSSVVPAEPAAGATVDGMVFANNALDASNDTSIDYNVGNGGDALYEGGDGEELRITVDQLAAGQQINIIVSYYIATP